MSWDGTILDTRSAGPGLVPRIDALFDHQRAHWKLLRDGEASLAKMQVKVLRDGDAQVLVQANPGRAPSIHAKVDPESIANRRCFLCPENLPAEERGIAFGSLVILPNPYPILGRHCTIADRRHVPQRIAGRLGTLLDLAKALGPEMVVFYNGPECGASAPDHFHFQACDCQGIPLLEELPSAGPVPIRFGYASFGRTMVVLIDSDAQRLESTIAGLLARLAQFEEACLGADQDPAGADFVRDPIASRWAPVAAVPKAHDPDRPVAGPAMREPRISLVAFYRDSHYVGILFPRAAHRPACYFAEEPYRIAVSPATLEMTGILVVTDCDHFDRLDARAARSIYEEVCLFQDTTLHLFLEETESVG